MVDINEIMEGWSDWLVEENKNYIYDNILQIGLLIPDLSLKMEKTTDSSTTVSDDRQYLRM